MNLIFGLKFLKITPSIKARLVVLTINFLLMGTFFVPSSLPQMVEKNIEKSATIINGHILYTPMASEITYLIDSNGNVKHTWSSSYLPSLIVRWLGNGEILRTIRVGAGPGGGGGGIQKVEWDGTVVWDFRYNTNGVLSHHDIKPLPNGNVLMIAWETKTRDEAIAAGRNPNFIFGGSFMPDHIIEVKPTGSSSGEIVWEWHVWDHLIQDYDSSKANYGVVGEHPELVDINFGTVSSGLTQDWLHTNSIDYNEEFDQILISVHNFNEIWVIDHSTTTTEASGHTGGNNGKGGDLLYRWGNPHAYRAGTNSNQQLFSQHDATWIEPGFPGEGNILIFNNGAERPDGNYSSVDEIVPPVDNTGHYYLESGSFYGPENPTWSYTANPPGSFYASSISGAQRLADGNTLICDGPAGRFFEVTSSGETVWQYTNPYPFPMANNVFKIVYIPPEEPPVPEPDLDTEGSLSWNNVQPGETVYGFFNIKNIGDSYSLLNWTINISSIEWGMWSFTPASGENLTPEDGQVTVQISVRAPEQRNSKFEGFIRVENRENSTDFDLISVYLKTPVNVSRVQIIIHSFLFAFKYRFFLFEKIWNSFK
jgi:hypothetical protein